VFLEKFSGVEIYRMMGKFCIKLRCFSEMVVFFCLRWFSGGFPSVLNLEDQWFLSSQVQFFFCYVLTDEGNIICFRNRWGY